MKNQDSIEQQLKQLQLKALDLNKQAHILNQQQSECIQSLQQLSKEIYQQPFLSDQVKSLFSRVQDLYPKPPHLILRLALGNSGPFVLRPIKRRLEYKKEYEIFKLKMTLITCVCAVISLFIYSSRLTDALYTFLLLYYYSTVLMREYILIVNGSKIRQWWIMHHYLSIASSAILLIWPSSHSYYAFRTPFLWFTLYLGILQYFQYRYQIQRLYVLVALEKADPMDTIVAEGPTSDKIGWEFYLLLPFSIIAQCWQLFNAYVLYFTYYSNMDSEWQLIAMACLFLILGIGNLSTTLCVFYSKVKLKQS